MCIRDRFNAARAATQPPAGTCVCRRARPGPASPVSADPTAHPLVRRHALSPASPVCPVPRPTTKLDACALSHHGRRTPQVRTCVAPSESSGLLARRLTSPSRPTGATKRRLVLWHRHVGAGSARHPRGLQTRRTVGPLPPTSSTSADPSRLLAAASSSDPPLDGRRVRLSLALKVRCLPADDVAPRRRLRFVRAGAVFVWEEEEAGIRRWTDHIKWSRASFSSSTRRLRRERLS